MKKKCILLLVIAVVLAATGLVGCKDAPTPKEEISLVMSESALTLERFAQKTLSVQVSGSTETVAWTTADETVLSLRPDGNQVLITGLAEGDTTVSAALGGETVTVPVYVNANAGVPVLNVSDRELTLRENDEYTLEAAVAYQGTNVAGADIAFASDTPAVLSTDNGVLRGLAPGSATVTVSATYCGYTLTPVTVAVTVIENATFSLDAAALTLYTSDPDDDGTYAVSGQLTAAATKNDAPITAEGVVWSSDKTDVAAVTDGLVTAVGKGTAVITATWNSGANVYTATCEVTVERPVVRAASPATDFDLSLKASAELNVGTVAYFAEHPATAAYAESGAEIGAVTDNKLTFDPSALPVGEQYITVTNGLLDYEMPVVVATMIVSDKTEFMKIKTEYFTGLRDNPPAPAKNRDGYFVLDANIDLGGDTFAMYGLGGDTLGRIDKHGWFGTLDGRGHIISRVVFGMNGFTDVMGWDTVIKNVGFVDCSFSDGVGSGLFGEFSYGAIDNCFFQFNNLKGTGALGKTLNNVSFTNSVVYISDFEPISGLRQNAIADSVGKDSVLNNLFAVTRANVPFISTVKLASGVSGKYESFAALRKSVGSLDAFHDAYWLKTDGTLIFKAYNDYLGRQFDDSAQTVAPSYFEGEQTEIAIADAEFAVSDTQYLDETLLRSGIIKPTGVPKGTSETVTLTVTSRLNPAIKAHKTLSLRNIDTTSLQPIDVDLDAAGGAGIELSVGAGVAEEIAWNGRALTIGNGSVTVEAGKITLPVSFMEANLGENDLVVLTASARYTVKVTVATLIIDNASDFKRIKSEFYKGDYTSTAANCRDGYFVLANNIDMQGAAFTMLDGVKLKKPNGDNTDVNNQACIDTYGWSGVLDGRGYAVHNFTTGISGMFGYLATDALIQNTAFVCNAITGNHGGVLANFMKGRIDNCFVEVTAMPNFSVIGLFGKYLHTTGRISNSLGSILTEDTTGQNQHSAIVQMINGAQTALDNVYTVRPGELKATGGKTSGSYGAYETMAELMTSGANFDGFSDEYWNVSDESVTWRSFGRLTEREIDSSLYDDADKPFTYTFTVNSDGEQVTSVSLDGAAADCTSSVSGRTATLTFTQSQLRAHLGEHTMTVVTDKAFYTGRMTIATLFIDSADDMKAMGGYMRKTEAASVNRDGYFIMTDDVDMKDEVGFTINDVGTSGPNASNSWCGMFDGRGYLLKNLTVKHSGIFGHIERYGVVKNLGITNATIQPRNNNPGSSLAGLFGVAVKGTIDNCFAELTAMPDATEAGVFGRHITDNSAVVSNSIVVIRSNENAGKKDSGAFARSTQDNKNVKVVNVYAVCPEGIPAVAIPGKNSVKTYGTFRTVADMLTAIKNKTGIEGDASKASLKGFDARYWTIDETAQTVSFGVKTKYPVSNPDSASL